MKKRWMPLLLLALLLLGQCAAAENLLKNPTFAEIEQGNQPLFWSRDLWDFNEGVSALNAVNLDGRSAVLIENIAENDASYAQTVSVTPDTLYKLTGEISCADCDSEEIGATLSIKNTFVYTAPLYETNGAWRTVTLYGKTGEDQTELTVQARLGGYGSLNVGRAYFSNLELTPVSEAAAGAEVVSFSTIPPTEAVSDTETVAENELMGSSGQTVLILAVGILFLLLAGTLILMAEKGRIAVAGQNPNPLKTLSILLATALIVRVLIALFVRGYGVDMSCFEGWASRVSQTGFAGFYSPDAFCDYPPGYMYVLWVCGSFLRGIGASFDGPIAWLVLKTTPILCDLFLAVLVYRVSREALGDSYALLLCGLCAFSPAVLINSAAWGQIDAVLTALVVLCMLEATKGRYWTALPIFAVAALIKPQALMFAPLGVLFLVVEIASSERKGMATLRVLGAVLGSLLLMALLAFPFMRALPDALLPKAVTLSLFGKTWTMGLAGWLRPLFWLAGQYGGTVSSYPFLTVNACNLYTLLNMNWVNLSAAPSTSLFASIMMGAAYVYSGFLYAKAKDRGKLFLVAATLLALLFSFSPMMHERYLYPALFLLLVAYAFDRDIRILVAFGLLGLTQFSNTALVLVNEHLLTSQQTVNAAISLINILTASFLGWTAFELCVLGRVVSITKPYTPPNGQPIRAKASPAVQEGLLHPRDARLNLKRRDFTLMILLTGLYAVVAFVNLGSTQAPQSQWRSTAPGEQVTFDLGQTSDFHMTYYGGICGSTFMVQFSEDGAVWTQAHYAVYDEGQIFRWLWYAPAEKDENDSIAKLDAGYPVSHARYVRLTAERAGLILNEVAFLDLNGAPLPVDSVHALGGKEGYASDPRMLVDEQNTVPPYPSYHNGMYFDEIYHGRTAYEHLNGLHAYEYTHPPLGKLLIMLGIKLFGMTPFGWRFMPALFGVLMVPLMYLLGKQLFRRSSLAFIGAFLLAVDCMHFTQSRLATIDVFAVFFIMLMYFFMIRYAMMSFYHVRLSRTLVPLGLSGLSMGFAIATKWIGIYGAIGLAVIFFFTIIQRYREHRYAVRALRTLDADQRRVAQRAVKQFWQNAAYTLAFCLLFFVVIPGCIYYFSYYYQMLPDGGLSIDGVWQIQRSMFSYHSGIAQNAHYFSSPWYEWPLIVKPMWYYSGTEFMPDGVISSISCMGNPVVWWGGLAAWVFIAIRLCAVARGDRRYLFLVIGFLSQYLPWIFITRATFIYHYFASVPFIILAMVAVFELIRKKSARAYKISACVTCSAALLLFVMFFPIMSGTPVPRTYAKYLRWFNWYNFEP